MNSVDVIVPVHDATRPLRRCVSSILMGTAADVRALVVAHNVSEHEVRRALGGLAKDPRVAVFPLDDAHPGPSTPKNHGLSLATADFVSFVDSDDALDPGALDRWLQIAKREHADFVIANRREPDGSNAASPPVRIGRRNGLEGVKDRLSYRAAPLGLLRRSRFGELRFPQGVPTGEDVPFSAGIWFSGARISFAFGPPGYVVHDDQPERATTAQRPVWELLRWLDPALNAEAPWMQRRADRVALVVKLLRQNLPDTARALLPGGWDAEAQSRVRAAVSRLHGAAPKAFDYLSRSDWRLVVALGSRATSEEQVAALLRDRQKLRSLRALLPHRLALTFARQSPLRFHLATKCLALGAPGDEAQTWGVMSASQTPGRMVYHAPFPVRPGATAASGIRPWKMLEAFRSIGYEVFEVTGHAKQRRKKFAELRNRIQRGWHPDFCYSEAATIPASFTEPKHFPLILNLERKIFRYLQDRRVPIGVFYRDVYWAFPDYVERVGRAVAAFMRLLYKREMETFNRYASIVFLPTKQMGSFVPGLRVPTLELPPGTDARAKSSPAPSTGPLRLLYVGDVGGDHYDVSALLEAVKDADNTTLTICCRPESWEKARVEYKDLLTDRVRVAHESGEGLEALYADSDVACLVMRPREYRTFAAPMKLYDYLGHGKPILASEGTHAADVVESSGAGWMVPFEGGAIARELQMLERNPEEVSRSAENAALAGQANTWEDRARFAAAALKRSQQEPSHPHVLVVPSWYPKNRDDAHGSFFREQAEAMSESGLKMGVLALDQNAVYATRRVAPRGFESRVEDGLAVVRGTLNSYVPLQRSLNTRLARRRLRAAWETYVAKNGTPDVIHAHSLYPGAFLAKALGDMYQIPFVYTEHRTLNHMPVRSKAASVVERRVAAAAASRHGVSEGHARHLSQRFGGLPWVYTPNLLPSLELRPRNDDQGETGQGFTFGHLSILDPVKRVEMLVEAFAKLRREDDTVRLLIGGAGEESGNVAAQVERLGLNDSVSLLGRLGRDEVASFYADIDAFVLPSATEPMGVVQIEALAAGVPVISTRTWGGETVIQDERDGLLVDIDDAEQLLAAMRALRSAVASSGDRAARAQRCVDRFGTNAFVERYRDIYTFAMRQGQE